MCGQQGICSWLTCFASWPPSRVENPRGLRDALAATQRDALAATRTDRALRTGPELRIRPQFKLPDWLLLASWSFEGLFSSCPTVSSFTTKKIYACPMTDSKCARIRRTVRAPRLKNRLSQLTKLK